MTQTGDTVKVVDRYNLATYTGTVSGNNFTAIGLYADEGGRSGDIKLLHPIQLDFRLVSTTIDGKENSYTICSRRLTHILPFGSLT